MPNSLADLNAASGLALTLQPRSSLSYEWIDVKDKDARRKARSHVIRESKHRQKLDTLRNQKIKEGSKRPLAPADAKTKTPQQGHQMELSILASHAHNYLPSVRTVLEGLIDPFNQFPIKLTSARDLGLVDHCKILATLLPSPKKKKIIIEGVVGLTHQYRLYHISSQAILVVALWLYTC